MHSATPQRNETSLYLTVSKDGGVLLDLVHDRLLKLNPSGVVIWKLLSEGVSSDEIAKGLAQEYQVDEARIRQDVSTLLRSASELDLDPRCSLTTSQETSAAEIRQVQLDSFPWYGQNENDTRPTPRPWLVAKAILGLAWFDAILSFRSFEALCRRVRLWPIKPQQGKADRERIGQVCSAVELACVWYPKKALCLQRSAVTACLLRSEGVDALMVVGVRAIPFRAHAWVETQGVVVNDWPRVRAFYSKATTY